MTTLSDVSGIRARIFNLPNRPPFMIAPDLAEVYGTSVKRLGEAVSRNPERFPDDFMFALTEAETERLRSQNATAKGQTAMARMDTLRSQNATANPISTKVRYAPLAFTHAGAYALSAVLKSETAARVSVIVHRAFAAAEQAALDEAKFLLVKLRTEHARRRPIRMQVIAGMMANLPFDGIWKMGSVSRPRLNIAARECLALGLIDRLPDGTPDMQPDLFGGQ